MSTQDILDQQHEEYKAAASRQHLVSINGYELHLVLDAIGVAALLLAKQKHVAANQREYIEGLAAIHERLNALDEQAKTG